MTIIVRNFQNINKNCQNTVLTIGNFDGLHLGHQEILNQAQKIASANNLKSALLTFEPHPLKIIRPNVAFKDNLQNLAQKLRILKQENLADIVFLQNFNQKLANLSAEDFVAEILVKKLKIKHLIVGYDFIFGKNRGGDAKLLQKLAAEHNFSFHQVAAHQVATFENCAQNICSSTKIRNFIKNGRIKEANLMSGRPYKVSGFVTKGAQMARKIGFKTTNFLPKDNLITPKFGVYKANALIGGQKFTAIVNFGTKPTFAGTRPIFEAHIFDFDQEIYGQKIKLELLDFIREEQKFANLEALKIQIINDIKKVKC